MSCENDRCIGTRKNETNTGMMSSLPIIFKTIFIEENSHLEWIYGVYTEELKLI